MAKSAFRTEFVDVPPQPAPFLARHPWVGYALFIVFGALFAYLSIEVKRNGWVTRWDMPVAQAVYQWAKQQPAWLVLTMRFFSAYGRDGVALIALALTVGWARKKARRELRWLFFGMLGGELWFQPLGGLVQRARPAFKDPFETLIGYGYPSGHAVTNLLLAWMLVAFVGPRLRGGWQRFALVFFSALSVLLVCFSRMFLGLHYLTDILGGLFLGAAWGGLIYTVIDVLHWRRRPGAIPIPHLAPPAAASGARAPE
jgi:undecaprenyl-diphosphatase